MHEKIIAEADKEVRRNKNHLQRQTIPTAMFEDEEKEE